MIEKSNLSDEQKIKLLQNKDSLSEDGLKEMINQLENPVAKKFCTNCGAEVKEDWKFCKGCGMKI